VGVTGSILVSCTFYSDIFIKVDRFNFSKLIRVNKLDSTLAISDTFHSMMKRFVSSLKSRLRIRTRLSFILQPAISLQAAVRNECNLYLGNLTLDLPQFSNGNFVGLAMQRISDRDLICDLRGNLPFSENSIAKVQAEDVLEHLVISDVKKLLDEIWRILIPTQGILRISVPDYRSPVLKTRSIYNYKGEILADLYTSTEVRYSINDNQLQVIRSQDGNAHQWYPTVETLRELISNSKFGVHGQAIFHHGFENDDDYFINEFPNLDMPVSRMPPNDLRANGAPVSIIVDLRKVLKV